MRIPIAEEELVAWVDFPGVGYKPLPLSSSHLQDRVRGIARNFKISKFCQFKKELPFRHKYYPEFYTDVQ